MGPIQVVVTDANNLVLEVTPTAETSIVLDRGVAGPVGMIWKGEWSSATTYNVNDAVYYAASNASYICILGNTNELPTNATYWELLVSGAGNVTGAASSTDNAVVRFDGTTGKLIQNSLVTIADDGATVIAANSTTNALLITQTGTGNALLVEDSANPDSTPFVIDAGGFVKIGTTVNVSPASVAEAPFQLAYVGSTSPLAVFRQGSNTTNGAELILEHARSGTTNAILGSGDNIGEIRMFGADGTDFIEAASIAAAVDGTPGTNDMPGRLVFSTTADGASSPTERMRINSAGAVSIGGTPSAGQTLQLVKTITGAVNGTAIRQQGVVQSDVTSTVFAIDNVLQTAAAAFTLPAYNHFNAQQATIGAGSSVTTQIGFSAGSSLVGATNNYGFYGNIASGAGRWNFYAAGTAANYFGGNTTIEVTDNTNAALRITQLGTGNALLVEDSANPDSSPFVIDANGSVAIGSNTAVERLNLVSDGRNFFQITRASTDSAESVVSFRKARGTNAAPTIIANGDGVGTFQYYGYDGAGYIQSASITASIDGTPGTNDMPGRLVFATTSDGAATPSERMRITSGGNVGVGTASPASKLDVNGTITATQYTGINGGTF